MIVSMSKQQVAELVTLREVLATIHGSIRAGGVQALAESLREAGVDVVTNWRGELAVPSTVALDLIADATESQKERARELQDYHDYCSSFEEAKRAARDEAYKSAYERRRVAEERQIVEGIREGFLTWDGVLTSTGRRSNWTGSPECASAARNAARDAVTAFIEDAAENGHVTVARDAHGGLVRVRPLDLVGWREAGRPATFDAPKKRKTSK